MNKNIKDSFLMGAILSLLMVVSISSEAGFLRNSTSFDIEADFVPAAYITVEHDKFYMPPSIYQQEYSSASDFFRIISSLQHALINIRGGAGEIVMVSCQIVTFEKSKKFYSGKPFAEWNCNGSEGATEQTPLVAGSTYKNDIYLDDLSVSWDPKKQIGSVSIDVFYI